MKQYASLILFFILCAGLKTAVAQDHSNFTKKATWVETILDAKTTDAGKGGSDNDLWKFLRQNFKSPNDLMQMSWEERDKIWSFDKQGFSFAVLGKNYVDGYHTSCNERGIPFGPITDKFNSIDDVWKARKVYLASRDMEYVILTPKVPLYPQINGPAVLGARPGHPIIYKVPVTGIKPIAIKVTGLPAGCSFNAKTGVITGSVSAPGDYNLTFMATNEKGRSIKKFTLKIGDKIALTPPMGWNSWNCFASDVTAKNIHDAAESLVKSGLADYGWTYINIDDCWMNRPASDDPIFKINADIPVKYEAKQAARKKSGRHRFDEEDLVGHTRDAQGRVLSNKDFPDMKGLTAYIHGLGLKAGIYISPGHLTCQDYIGSYGHEDQDAQQFANWGFDYLKYDWCGYSAINPDRSAGTMQKPYQLMSNSLSKVNRDIVYSLCEYGWADVWKWGEQVGGNLWRTTGDIRDTWESLKKIGFTPLNNAAYAGPGHWNDVDMLVVGYVGWSKNLRPTYLSPNEQYTHVSLWSLLSAPLIIGADLTKLDDFTFNLLANREVIAVNQDVLGKQATRIIDNGNIQVYLKPLADGSVAVGVFNLGETPEKYRLDLKAVNLSGNYTIRDLWRQLDVATSATNYDMTVNRHGVKLFKITASKK